MHKNLQTFQYKKVLTNVLQTKPAVLTILKLTLLKYWTIHIKTFCQPRCEHSFMNLQSSPLIIQSMRDLTWYLSHPPMLYIFLDCFILFLPHIFSDFVVTSLPSAREAAMTKIKKNSVQSHQYQRTTIYMIPNHLHYIVIQELLLKISLDCISSFAPLLKDYNTTTRRYHCQDWFTAGGWYDANN